MTITTMTTSWVMPDFSGKSEILEPYHIQKLSEHLCGRSVGYTWTLAFTTSHMGFSLRSLYRSLKNHEGPVLLVIKDTNDIVFGAFSTQGIRPSESFYGTGETYLYTFKDAKQFKRFPWSGKNIYFVKGNMDSLALGAGEGSFGLWLDVDLFHGSSHECKTYDNEKLTIEDDFVVSALECWSFV